MPIQPDVLVVEFGAFNGANLKQDAYQVPPSNALYAQNYSFVAGQFSTRYGHSAVVAQADGAVPSLANWYFLFGTTPVSVLAYFTPTIGAVAATPGIRTLNLSGNTVATIMTTTGSPAGASMVTDAQRIFAAFYDATGRQGTAGGQIYGWNVGADPLFYHPITNVPTASETGTGVCTAGMHRIGFLLQTRNGYTTALCPVNSGGVFAPIEFTSTGNHNIQVSIPGPFDANISGGSIQIVMATVANPNQYFAVPGAIEQGAIANPTIITISINDADLAATGTDSTSYQDLLTCSVSGTPPFLPSAIFAYSSRIGYVSVDSDGFPVVYMSDQNNDQYVTADQHGIYFDGSVQPIQGFSLRGVCYIFSQHSLYSTSDNGDVPVTWTPPQKVDGSIGILAPDCVTTNPAQGYAIVASDRGAYIFQGGLFPPLPFSYNQQSDWQRINWAVATTVKVLDDQLNKRVVIVAPLTTTVTAASNTNPIQITTGNDPHLYQTGVSVLISGVGGNTAANGTFAITVTGSNTFTIPATGNGAYTSGGTVAPQTATHRMTWDYTEGEDFQTMKYSLNSMGVYLTGSAATVQNPATYLNEIWYGPSVAGYFIRSNDGTEQFPYRDVDVNGNPGAISRIYQTSLAPGADDPNGPGVLIHDFHGAFFRMKGTSQLAIVCLGLDGTTQVTPVLSPIQLSPTPGQEYLLGWWLRSEQASVLVGSSQIDTYETVALIRMQYTNTLGQR